MKKPLLPLCLCAALPAVALNVSKEVLPGELARRDNPAYDGVSLHATRNPGFDPYEYVYW